MVFVFAAVFVDHRVASRVAICATSLIAGLLFVGAGRGRPEVAHQRLQVDQLDGVGELRLAQNAHKTIDLDLVELLDADLVASCDEVVGGHHLDVLLALELGQVVDDVLPAERLPHGQVVHQQALRDHIEDSLSDVQHLLLANLDLHRLLLTLILLLLILIVLIVTPPLLLLLLLLLLPILIVVVLVLVLLLSFLFSRVFDVRRLLLVLFDRCSFRLLLAFRLLLGVVERLELLLVLRVLILLIPLIPLIVIAPRSRGCLLLLLSGSGSILFLLVLLLLIPFLLGRFFHNGVRWRHSLISILEGGSLLVTLTLFLLGRLDVVDVE